MTASTSESGTKSTLPDWMLKLINGEADEQTKKEQYDQSLQRWWHEYASRKNDEEQEHVADSLLYDERCHLPRTTPPPVCVSQQQQQQQQQAPSTEQKSVPSNGHDANGSS